MKEQRTHVCTESLQRGLCWLWHGLPVSDPLVQPSPILHPAWMGKRRLGRSGGHREKAHTPQGSCPRRDLPGLSPALRGPLDGPAPAASARATPDPCTLHASLSPKMTWPPQAVIPPEGSDQGPRWGCLGVLAVKGGVTTTAGGMSPKQWLQCCKWGCEEAAWQCCCLANLFPC